MKITRKEKALLKKIEQLELYNDILTERVEELEEFIDSLDLSMAALTQGIEPLVKP